MRKRLLHIAGLLLGGGLCLGLLVLVTRQVGFGIPCILHAVTGLQCPGCGGWRMLLALLDGDLRGAFAWNPALLLLSPVLAGLLGSCLVRYVKSGITTTTRLQNTVALGLLALLLGFGVWRNL